MRQEVKMIEQLKDMLKCWEDIMEDAAKSNDEYNIGKYIGIRHCVATLKARCIASGINLEEE